MTQYSVWKLLLTSQVHFIYVFNLLAQYKVEYKLHKPTTQDGFPRA